MNSRIRCALVSLALAVGAASVASAAPQAASVDLTTLRAIQKYTMDAKAPDQVYLLVDGVAGGKPVQARFPEGGKTWEGGPKQLPVDEKSAVTLWKGELNDGEFALLAISVFQGEGKDAAVLKGYEEKINDAVKSAGEKKTIAGAADADALLGGSKAQQFTPGTVVKAEQAVISKIHDTFSRPKNTDHYSGLFNVLVWNDGKAIQKRVVPVGLTFGAHFGTDVKTYTKLKYTRKDNVFVKEEGQWTIEQLSPLSDDEQTLRVKMLETEVVKGPEGLDKKTTDYLAEIQVKAGGKPTKWKLEGEVTGVDDIHTYWEYAD